MRRIGAQRLLVLGPPGSGVDDVAAALGLPVLSQAAIVRAAFRAGTPAAQEANRLMLAGEVIPERLLLAMIGSRLTAPDVAEGFALTGFTGHAVQGPALDALLAAPRRQP